MDGGGEGRGGRVITREVVESERVGVGVKGVTIVALHFFYSQLFLHSLKSMATSPLTLCWCGCRTLSPPANAC